MITPAPIAFGAIYAPVLDLSLVMFIEWACSRILVEVYDKH